MINYKICLDSDIRLQSTFNTTELRFVNQYLLQSVLFLSNRNIHSAKIKI